MTKPFSIRLNDSEREMLSQILSSENCESENAGDWFRLLLHREWNKPRHLGVPQPSLYQGAHRAGSRWSSRRVNEKLQECIDKFSGPARNTHLAGTSRDTRLRSQVRITGSISPSSTRAASGASKSTKIPRVTRRVGVQLLRAK
jgi:hypothetical protein